MHSFLEGRKQYVEIQGFKSSVQPIGRCSVLQGTKKSGFYYTLNNLEVVYLREVMKNPKLYKQITGANLKEYPDEEHETINFVDDSSLLIASSDPTKFTSYL